MPMILKAVLVSHDYVMCPIFPLFTFARQFFASLTVCFNRTSHLDRELAQVHLLSADPL